MRRGQHTRLLRLLVTHWQVLLPALAHTHTPAHHDVLGLVCCRLLVQQRVGRVVCEPSLAHSIQLLF